MNQPGRSHRRTTLLPLTLLLPPLALLAGCFCFGPESNEGVGPLKDRIVDGPSGDAGDAGHASDAGAPPPTDPAPGAGGAAGASGPPSSGGANGGSPGGGAPDAGPTGNGTGGGGGAPSGPSGGGTAGVSGGTGGTAGTSVCAVTCIFDGAFCQCITNPAECDQVYRLTCPNGAAGNCTCRVGPETFKTIPGSACDVSQLSDPAGCGFPLMVSMPLPQ